MVSTIDGACVDWAAASAVAPGHHESGDERVVRAIDHRTVLAVLDGLGHGPEAATAARVGVAMLECSNTPDVVELIRACHDGLRGTRGAVMSVAIVDGAQSTMTWLGVGDVRGSLWCPRLSTWHSLLLRSGVVGSYLPQLQASVIPLNEGDTLLFTTDGVSPILDQSLLKGDSLQAMAERILARCHTGRDDALVLLARYRGAGR
jgi:hypothetical protein